MTRDELLKKICPLGICGCGDDYEICYCDDCNRVLEEWFYEYDKQIRAEVIDDFVKKIKESNQGHWRPTRYEHGEVVSETMSYDIGTIRLIAKQLKAGGKE